MKNDYTLLQKENRLRSSFLQEHNQTVLDRMFRYLESKALNPYDVSMMRKELISMALAAEAQNQSLEAVLGVSEHEFCDSLAAEGRKVTLADRTAFYLPPLLGMISAIQIPITLLSGNLLEAKTRVSLGLFIAYLLIFFVFLYFGGSLWTAKSIYFDKRKHWLFQIGSTMAGIFIFCLIIIGGSRFSDKYWEIPTILYISGWAVLWLLSEWYQKKHAACLAAGHPWMDS